MQEFEEIRSELKNILKPDRYRHTTGVMYTAASLAMRYDADIKKAMYAGLLHDCGKFTSGEEQIKLCRQHGILLTESEIAMPALVHAKLGAYYAETKYGVEDKDIINAIIYHTTGRPAMTMLEKIIYIADYIEPNRKMIPKLDKVRKLAFTDIDKSIALSAASTIGYLNRAGKPVDPMTSKTLEYYETKEV